jgi:hypothetical protein
MYQVLNANHRLSGIADAAGTSRVDNPENRYRDHGGNRDSTKYCGERYQSLCENSLPIGCWCCLSLTHRISARKA